VRYLFRILLQALTGHTVRVRSILADAWGWRLVSTEVLANGFIKGGHRLLDSRCAAECQNLLQGQAGAFGHLLGHFHLAGLSPRIRHSIASLTSLFYPVLAWTPHSLSSPVERRSNVMTLRYMVGTRVGKHSASVTVEAEDALIAALKVKHQNPTAMITYVRKSNVRGDLRHPHPDVAESLK
jgi:hypothetical protein